jgi:hypothetical protein
MTDISARKFADLIEGRHELDGEHRDKVIRLYQIKVGFDAMQEAAWHEHTTDWDWRLTVQTVHGLCFGTTDVGDQWADSFDLYYSPNNRIEADDSFTACVDHAKVGYIGVLINRDDGSEDIHYIEVDHIAGVVYQQA